MSQVLSLGMFPQFYAPPVQHQQEDELVPLLRRIASALETLVSQVEAKDDVQGEIPVSPWDSPEVPDGYDTVVGFFARSMPGAFDLMDDPITGTQRDGFWCQHQANKRGLSVAKVTAPEPLLEAGIETVNAYPIELLEERFGL